jgi:tRNA modification GTPase
VIMDNSTIAAIATPSGRGGIGIIKISGPEAVSIAKTIFHPRVSGLNSDADIHLKSSANGNGYFKSHRLYYGEVRDPADERILDEVLMTVMKAPRTYTREDVVEINAHGGAAALQAILALVLRRGARLAQPGEFTKRAFLNGRIDLTQAEAVIDMINAVTEKSLRIAAAQIEGQLKNQVQALRKILVALLTRVEAAIDFPEDVEDIVDPKKTALEIRTAVVGPLKRLIRHYSDARILRDGLKVAVVGKPNVGKSSLMNRLVQKERAIVTSIPGTTRDVIEETINLQGIPVIISDTAGLHESHDPIEAIGIEKTLEHVNGSDLVLFLTEAIGPLNAEDYQVFEKVKSKPLIIVINKIDLAADETAALIPDSWGKTERVRISALYGRGIDSLKDKIIRAVQGERPIDFDASIVPNLRHKVAFERCFEAAASVVFQMRNGTSTDLIALDLQEAVDALDEVLGTNVKLDVLEQIFSRFCLGK